MHDLQDSHCNVVNSIVNTSWWLLVLPNACSGSSDTQVLLCCWLHILSLFLALCIWQPVKRTRGAYSALNNRCSIATEHEGNAIARMRRGLHLMIFCWNHNSRGRRRCQPVQASPAQPTQSDRNKR